MIPNMKDWYPINYHSKIIKVFCRQVNKQTDRQTDGTKTVYNPNLINAGA